MRTFAFILLVTAAAAWPVTTHAQEAQATRGARETSVVPQEARQDKPPADGPLVLERRRPVDRTHRIELRLAATHSPNASFVQDGGHVRWGSGEVGGGFEYLHYVSGDLAVGLAIESQTRGEGNGEWWDEDWANGAATVSMPLVARWNFMRRATEWRGIEPYVTAGIGPVFRADWFNSGSTHRHSRTEGNVSTTVGGRIGAGFDIRLGSVWTLGVVGTWRWSDRPDGVVGYGKHDRGGQVAFTTGWMFGRKR